MCENRQRHEITTSWGKIIVRTQGGKLLDCTLPYLDDDPLIPFSIQSSGNDTITRYIIDLFNGLDPECPVLATLAGTPFQSVVWEALLTIPKGTTRTYTEISKCIGHPKASRAVANACGRNPLPLFIPCHRVIGADGSLRGFSSGITWKRLLLTIESDGRI